MEKERTQLTSTKHPLIARCLSLRLDKEVREKERAVFIAGKMLVHELSRKIPLLTLISLEKSNLKAQESYLVTPEILKKITGLQEPDGWAAIVPLPPPQDVLAKQRVLILDRLADPGNVGNLIRTALALGWEGIIGTPGTVDFFNDKALRAARGATFHLPYQILPRDILVAQLTTRDAFVADTKGTTLDNMKSHRSITLILSSEAHGPQGWDFLPKVSIPMNGTVESLNVAAAGAILLYALRAHT
ncbi:MAG: RNA methyltransferase [Chlamydiia bacterium]|nr:RNA methyltransferase [Chlamydiia bacterium]